MLKILIEDILVKSRFNEMFGKIDKKVELIKLCNAKPRYGANSAAKKFEINRPRYIRITDINDDGSLGDEWVVSSNVSDDTNYLLKYGDFLFARTGASTGRTYYATELNTIFAGYLICFNLNLNLILPEYLFWFAKTDEYYVWLQAKQKGSAQPGINAKMYSSLCIPVPDIKTQKQFTLLLRQINKLKFNAEERIKLYKELLNKKMDEYFG